MTTPQLPTETREINENMKDQAERETPKNRGVAG